ncbi:methionyl-tRNA formyltransferase [bacterium]|nr:methionyl-tRNA formyltransferase [bacterium]
MADKVYNIIFFGSPEFAVPSLSALSADRRFNLLACITQTDKPAGRGQKLSPPAVKVLAQKLGLPVFQPKSLKNILQSETDFGRFLQTHQQIDAAILVAYGKIIPPELLQYPGFGVINIHPSDLPRWRGPAPMQHTIRAGDKSTAISIMQLDTGVDTGPVFAKKHFTVSPNETFGELHDRLAVAGAKFLLEVLPEILTAQLKAEEQLDSNVTFAEKFPKDYFKIDWNQAPEVVTQQIHALSPSPGARTNYQGQLIKIYRTRLTNLKLNTYQPDCFKAGTIVSISRGELLVATGQNGIVALEELQFAGKKILPIKDIINSKVFSRGDYFE